MYGFPSQSCGPILYNPKAQYVSTYRSKRPIGSKSNFKHRPFLLPKLLRSGPPPPGAQRSSACVVTELTSASLQCCIQPLGHRRFPSDCAGVGGSRRPATSTSPRFRRLRPVHELPLRSALRVREAHPPCPAPPSRMLPTRLPPGCSPGPPQQQALPCPFCHRFSFPELPNFGNPGSKGATGGTARLPGSGRGK